MLPQPSRRRNTIPTFRTTFIRRRISLSDRTYPMDKKATRIRELTARIAELEAESYRKSEQAARIDDARLALRAAIRKVGDLPRTTIGGAWDILADAYDADDEAAMERGALTDAQPSPRR